MNAAYQWMTGLLRAVGSKPGQDSNRNGSLWQCPAHNDAAPSLSVRAAPDGSVWVTCFRGCPRRAVLDALRLSEPPSGTGPFIDPAEYARRARIRIGFPPVTRHAGHPASRGYRLEAMHDYGRAILLRWRNGQQKELLWETRLDDGTTIPGLVGVRLTDLPLYREREIQQATALGEPVLVVESESSCDAIKGMYVTTWAGGAPAVNIGRLATVLGGYPRIVVIPDNDPAGLAVLRRLEAAGLAPAHILPAEGEDARDLYTKTGAQGLADLVNAALHGHQIRSAA